MSQLKKPAYVNDLITNGLQTLPSMPRAQQNEMVQWARSIVEHFDLVLEKNPAKLKNITLLPCPEAELKLAIKILLMLHVAKDDTVDVEALKRRYISIASFQHIRREDMAALTKAMGRANEDSQMSDREAYPSYQKYLDLALAEQNTLLDDINNFIGSIEDL